MKPIKTNILPRLLLVSATVSAFISCNQPAPDPAGFLKTASGMEYKIISGKQQSPAATSGSTVKLYQNWYWHDTLRRSNRDTMPLYQQLISGLIFPYEPSEALIQGVRRGDSVVVKLRLDSLLTQKKIPRLPAGSRPNDAWRITMKVLEVFPYDPLRSDSIVMADKLKEMTKVRPK